MNEHGNQFLNAVKIFSNTSYIKTASKLNATLRIAVKNKFPFSIKKHHAFTEH